MNIQQFHYVLAVDELRHFEKAADKCFISQSTLSTMISKFEDEIGITIFDRRTKPVGITVEGKNIINQLKIIISEIDRLDKIVDETKGSKAAKIRMGCIPTVSPFLLPIFLKDFTRKHPEIEFEIKEKTTQDIIRSIHTRDLDIGIVSVPIHSPDIIEYPLYTEPFVYYDTAYLPVGSVSLEDINLENFWLLEDGHCMRDQILDLCNIDKEEVSPGPNIRFRAGSIGSLIRFVNIYGGQTLLPYLSILNFTKKEAANVRYFEDPPPGRGIGLIVHKYFVRKKVLKMIQKGITEKMLPLLNTYPK